MHRQPAHHSTYFILLLLLLLLLPFISCRQQDTTAAVTTRQCPLHHATLIEQTGFFAQDASAKPSRDLIPLLAEADSLYPHMTPWNFSPHQSETYPTPGNTQTCPQCDLTVSTKLKRAYPDSEH